jgi:protein phosphatase
MNPENNSDNATAGGKLIRILRPSIVVLCGPAASGKSTFAERHFRPTQVISSDWARARVSDDDRDQRYNAQAFALVHFLVEQRLTVNRLCVVDSTALTAQARTDLLDLAKKHQVPATLLLFNVPLETCIERDTNRERSVGKVVVERQYQAFEQSKETIRQEGFDQIVELQDVDLEKVQIDILFRPVARPMQRPQQPEARAPRRFERSTEPSRPRPSGREGGGRSASTPTVAPVARRPAASPPATTAGTASTPQAATPRPGNGPASVARPHPPSVVHSAASPTAVQKPGIPPSAAVNAKPAPPAAARPVPAGAEPQAKASNVG